MLEAKETRPAVGAAERAEENGSVCEAIQLSFLEDTTPISARQPLRIAELLSHGVANGQTITDLERLTGWKSREIRRMIEFERRSGSLIISDNRNGYYLTADPGEAQRFAQSMRHRAAEIVKTAEAIERARG